MPVTVTAGEVHGRIGVCGIRAQGLFDNRVTAALDSMMVGEAQITGQAKEAHEMAHNMGLLGGILDQTFHEAFNLAKRIRTEHYRIAGKTGTAQVFTVAQDEEYDEETVEKRKRDHALFIAFAPVENPRIAVAVVVENGGHGGAVAAPIAKKVIDQYLLGEVEGT